MRMCRLLPLVVLAGALPALPARAATKLEIDPQHSNVGFSVRHLFTRVQGRFRDFSGSLTFDEANPASSSVRATIQVASVDTNVAARDTDLRSSRFFDVERFPTLEFRSTAIEKGAGAKFAVRGDLTMHGVARPVVLDAEFLGQGKDPWGNERYGFHAETTVSRAEFGMEWNEVLEAGGVLVGDEVRIALDIEALPAAD